jgi:hypothetical protein
VLKLYEVLCIILVYCGQYCVWFNECVYVFLIWNFVFNGGIRVVGWRVFVNGLLLVIVLHLLVIYCSGILPPICGAILLYQQFREVILCVVATR